MIKTKNLNICTCNFSYDKHRKLLFISMLRHGKIFYKTAIRYANNKFANCFVKNFDDNTAREIKSLEMEQL